MIRSFVRALAAAAVAGAALGGAALAAPEWSKMTLAALIEAGREKAKEKGDLVLERLSVVGLREDGTADLTAAGSAAQVLFRGKDGKTWSVSLTGLGQPEPYAMVSEAIATGEPLGDAAKNFKDGAELARAAKAAGISFPANVSIYAVEAGKAWAVFSDMAGKSAIIDPATAQKIH